MPISFIETLVISAMSAALAQAPIAKPQAPDPVTDPDAYAIYATVLPAMWRVVSKDVVLIQQETGTTEGCARKPATDAEWAAVESNFKAENARVRLLQPILRVDIPYRFVSRADIAADDRRLELKYPGTWQRRPGSMEYAAVSAVGFNASKTKAIVHVWRRSSGSVRWLEKRDGKWVPAQNSGGCRWIV